MIDKFEARTNSGVVLTMELDDITDGFVLQSIDGLDPVKATLVSSSFANLNGAQFQSSKREPRNIIITIALDPYDLTTQNVRGLRQQLYGFFMPETEVQLRFYLDDDAFVVNVTGWVETFESPLFTDKPLVTISLMCFDPDFVETTLHFLDDNSVNDLTETSIDYSGTLDTGVLFTFLPDRSLSEFTIYHRPADGITRTFDFQADLVAGDRVEISTVDGNKYVHLTHSGGSVISILYAMTAQSDWIQLKPGNNAIRVFAEGAPIPYEFSWLARHGGL